ncbi:MAG: signal peptidase I [Planctomycetota bacterium]|nr:MAG: signal peptidase I [Planctomycetota bacterium]
MILNRRFRILVVSLGLLLILTMLCTPVRVAGPSMRPGLVEGQVLVATSTILRHPARNDLVVFSEPDTGTTALKRVVGLPGEEVLLQDGDLYLDGRRYARPIHRAQDLVPLVDTGARDADLCFALREAGFEAEGDRWFLGGASHARLRQTLRTGYLLAGEEHFSVEPARDVGVEVDFQLHAAESVFELAILERDLVFSVQLADFGRRLRISMADPHREQVLQETELDQETPSGTLFLGNTDGGLTVSLQGQVLADHLPYEVPAQPGENGASRHPFAQIEVGGQGPLSLGGVRIGRDFFWREEDGRYASGRALELGENEFFLLGDDSWNSRDSRNYGPVRREHVQGIVTWRIWPPGKPGLGW